MEKYMKIIEEVLKIIDFFSIACMIYYVVIVLCPLRKSKNETDSKDFKK